MAEKLQKLPEVSQTQTLLSFVPQDQDKKLALIEELSRQLAPALGRPGSSKAPTDGENVAALNGMADQLNKIAGNATGPGADAARRLAGNAVKLAQASEEIRARAKTVFIVPMETATGQLRGFLGAQKVTKDNLPQALKQQWLAADGRARVEIAPKGNTNDTEVLRQFARAILSVYPSATGGPISILEFEPNCCAGVLRSGLLCAHLNWNLAVDRPATLRRCSADSCPAPFGRGRDARDLRLDRHAAELREHHRLAAASGRRRRVQNLLHHGLAIGPHELASIKPDARGDLERVNDCDGVR